MQSYSDPLNNLHEDGSWFARAHELRLWLLRCDADLRKPALTLVPKFEFHHDNRSPWPVLVDAYMTGDDGWQLRANVLARDWAERVVAFAGEGIVQGPVEASAGPPGLACFRATLIRVLEAMAPPIVGFVVVLAPTVVEKVDALASDVAELLGDPALGRCRFVVILDLDVPPPTTLLDALGPVAAQVTLCRVDDDAKASDLRAMLSASDARQLGMAWPMGVIPPPRVGDPPSIPTAERDALLRAEGIEPALMDGAPQLRVEVLAAAVAMKDGHGAEAIARQSEACRLCATLGLRELEIICRTSLAAYLSGLGERARAKQVLSETVELARSHGLRRGENQALLALGLVHNLDREYPAAIAAYTEAARAAEAGDEPLLAIEAWRMSGQLAAQQGLDHAAVEAFGHAVRVGRATEVELVSNSSAPEAARQLASLYTRHGMHEHAASLHALADAMEATQPAVGEAVPA